MIDCDDGLGQRAKVSIHPFNPTFRAIILPLKITSLNRSSAMSSSSSSSSVSVSDVRFQWWEVTVILFNVIVPSIVAAAILVAPNAILMDGHELRVRGKGGDEIDSINVNEVFRDVARTMACASLLMVFMAYAAATTTKIHVLFFCSALVAGYYSCILLVMLIQWGVEGFLDIFTFCMDLFTVLLHAFVVVRIRMKSSTSESQEEQIRLIV